MVERRGSTPAVRRLNDIRMSDWIHKYFEHGYAQRWGALELTDNVRRQTSDLWPLLGLQSGALIADLGCGSGRYALAFTERGARVVGIDSAVTLLAQAQRFSSELNLSTLWVRGDMRCVPLQSRLFRAVVIMDAFGYFEAEDENEGVLAEAARLLVPGGRCLLKVVNGVPIVAGFRTADREERDGTVVTITRALARDPARMIERVSVTGPRGYGQYERRQRLYGAAELITASERAGFAIVGIFADASGAAFDPGTSPTMWVIGQRSAV
jgi:SAM-dependent methyltransferase